MEYQNKFADEKSRGFIPICKRVNYIIACARVLPLNNHYYNNIQKARYNLLNNIPDENSENTFYYQILQGVIDGIQLRKEVLIHHIFVKIQNIQQEVTTYEHYTGNNNRLR